MPSRRIVQVSFAVVAVAAALVGRVAIERSVASLPPAAMDIGGEPFAKDPQRLAVIEVAGRKLRPLHTRMGKPDPGDWLDRHAEAGQSFEAYRGGCPSRPTSQLTTLYIQTWGEFDATQSLLVNRVAELLGRFYGIPVKFLGPVSLDSIDVSALSDPPDGGGGDRRILSTYVLEKLGSASRPPDAAGVLALTTVDLTRNGRGAWAFGQASLCDRVAVCSLFRQGDAHQDFTLCLKRTLKTCVHEVGHMFGIPHCAAYECAMNGSSNREEADSRPLWFCPEDEMKVWLACGLDPSQRYARLAEWCDANGLDVEARFWRRSFAALRERRAPEP